MDNSTKTLKVDSLLKAMKSMGLPPLKLNTDELLFLENSARDLRDPSQVDLTGLKVYLGYSSFKHDQQSKEVK